ncbi:MAG: hypothetical protein ACSHXW_02425 [Yoonia sp.]
MQTNEFIITPAQVEGLTGWTAQTLRDLRGKSYLFGYGQRQENGRWMYSAKDVCSIFVAEMILAADRSKSRANVALALEHARLIVGQFDKYLGTGEPNKVKFHYEVRNGEDGLSLYNSEFDDGTKSLRFKPFQSVEYDLASIFDFLHENLPDLLPDQEK